MSCTPEKIAWSSEPTLEMVLTKMPQTKGELSWFRRREQYRLRSPRTQHSPDMFMVQSDDLTPRHSTDVEGLVVPRMSAVNDTGKPVSHNAEEIANAKAHDVVNASHDLPIQATKPEPKSSFPNSFAGMCTINSDTSKCLNVVKSASNPSLRVPFPDPTKGINPFAKISLTASNNPLPLFDGGGFKSLGKALNAIPVDASPISNVDMSIKIEEKSRTSSYRPSFCLKPLSSLSALNSSLEKNPALNLFVPPAGSSDNPDPTERHNTLVHDTCQDTNGTQKVDLLEKLRESEEISVAKSNVDNEVVSPAGPEHDEPSVMIHTKPVCTVVDMKSMSDDELLQVEDGKLNDTELEMLRQRLITFYERHNPSKVDSVSLTLHKFHGREVVLMQKLRSKYISTNPGIPSPKGKGPKCFLDFEIEGLPVGTIEISLFADMVPLAAENFRSLCTGEKGAGVNTAGKCLCYRNCSIHRIVPGFCIQGGDFIKNDGTGGVSIYPPNSDHGDMWGKFKDELFMGHTRKGLLSMANNGPNRNGSQFFITLRPTPHLDNKHVVFGVVTAGDEVIDRLGKLKTDKNQRPLEDIRITDCGEIRDDGTVVRASATSGENPSRVLRDHSCGASLLTSFEKSLSPPQTTSNRATIVGSMWKSTDIDSKVSSISSFSEQSVIKSTKNTLSHQNVQKSDGSKLQRNNSLIFEDKECISKTNFSICGNKEAKHLTRDTDASRSVVTDAVPLGTFRQAPLIQTDKDVSKQKVNGQKIGLPKNPFANVTLGNSHARDPPSIFGSRDFTALRTGETNPISFQTLRRGQMEIEPSELPVSVHSVLIPACTAIEHQYDNIPKESKLVTPVKALAADCIAEPLDEASQFLAISAGEHQIADLTMSFQSSPSKNASTRNLLGNRSRQEGSPCHNEQYDSKDSMKPKESHLLSERSDREELIAFYETYNPSKCKMVDRILLAYDGQRDLLWQRLKIKYALPDKEKEEIILSSSMKASVNDLPTVFPDHAHRINSPSASSCPPMKAVTDVPTKDSSPGGIQMCSLLCPIPSEFESKDSFRNFLVETYKIHNPSKLKEIDKLLQKYRSKESELIEKISKKYLLCCTPSSLEGKLCLSSPHQQDVVLSSGISSDSLSGGKAIPGFISVPSSGSKVSSVFGIGSDRYRLTRFYEKYNPSKVDEIDKILEAYEGQSDLLFERLSEKYKVSLEQDEISESEISILGDTDLDFVVAPEHSVDAMLRNDQRKARLMEFYVKHNPSKVSQIDQILKAYEGDKNELEKLITSKSPLNQSTSEGVPLTSKNGVEMRRIAMHNRLTAFYNRYNPSKLSSVDELLDSYKGREHLLFRKLIQNIDKVFPHAQQVLSPPSQSRRYEKCEHHECKHTHDYDLQPRTDDNVGLQAPLSTLCPTNATRGFIKRENSTMKQDLPVMKSPTRETFSFHSQSSTLMKNSTPCDKHPLISNSMSVAKQSTEATNPAKKSVSENLYFSATRGALTPLHLRENADIIENQTSQTQEEPEGSSVGFVKPTTGQSSSLTPSVLSQTFNNFGSSPRQSSQLNPFAPLQREGSTLTTRASGFLDSFPISQNNPFSKRNTNQNSTGPFSRVHTVTSKGTQFLDNFKPAADNPFAKGNAVISPLTAKQSSFLQEVKPSLNNPFVTQSQVKSQVPKIHKKDIATNQNKKPLTENTRAMSGNLSARVKQTGGEASNSTDSKNMLKGTSSLVAALQHAQKQPK